MPILTPILRPILRPVLTSVFERGVGGGASSLTAKVQALFPKYSAKGGMWDFTDMGTLFQDSARTVPVTAASQPVGGVNDISGLHSVLAQPTSGKRPQFNGAGVTPDGVDDFFVTASNLDLTACDKVVVAMGYTKVADALLDQARSTGSHGNPGSFYLLTGSGGGAGHQPALVSGASVNYIYASMPSAVPNGYGSHIARGSIPTNRVDVWWNGVLGIPSTAAQGGGTYANGIVEFLLASNTPARRALVMGVPVAGPQVSDDDIELIRLWLMEGV